MSSEVLLGSDVACCVMAFAGEGNYLFLAIQKDWLAAHTRVFGASNKKTVVASKHMSAPQMRLVLNSDAAKQVDVMDVAVRKGLFSFARRASLPPYNLNMFSRKVFGSAAFSGNLAMTAFIGRRVQSPTLTYKKNVALCAAAGGSVDMVRFLLREGHMAARGSAALDLLHNGMVEEAVANGRVSVLGLLLSDGEFKSAMGGFKWRGWNDIFRVLEKRAYVGDLRTLRWFLNDGGVKGMHDVCGVLSAAAAAAGNVDTLKFLWKEGCPLTRSVFKSAGKACNKEVLDWLVQNGCPVDTGVFIEAADHGNLEALQWAVDFGLACPDMAVDIATFYGNKDALGIMGEKYNLN